jgi:nicotinamide-nucleotide amidase
MAMNPLNEKQAEVLSRSLVIPNNCGTAPGMWFEKGHIVYVSMPGVPFEMKTMMENEILPRLKEHFRTGNIIHRTLLVTGIPESSLALLIEDWENKLPPYIGLAYLPSGGMIRLRLSASGDDRNAISNEVDSAVRTLRPVLGKHLLSENDELIEELAARLLTEKGKTVSTAESCTGGNIARLLTSIPGSSNYFKGSVVAYANEVKVNILSVNPDDIEKHGAVSEEVVVQMAENVRKIMKTDYSIATSGIAGPTGGTPGKPAGTIWIAVASEKQTVTRLLHLGNNRENNIQRTGTATFHLLIETLE